MTGSQVDPLNTRRETPSRYPITSWRWLFLDRVVAMRVAGTEPIDGVKPGDIIGYVPIEVGLALKHWKFQRAYSRWRRLTTVRMRCGCGHHFWRRKPYVTSPSCDLHGIRKLLNDLYREHPELERSA